MIISRDNTGFIGMGTTVPTAPLHISSFEGGELLKIEKPVATDVAFLSANQRCVLCGRVWTHRIYVC